MGCHPKQFLMLELRTEKELGDITEKELGHITTCQTVPHLEILG